MADFQNINIESLEKMIFHHKNETTADFQNFLNQNGGIAKEMQSNVKLVFKIESIRIESPFS